MITPELLKYVQDQKAAGVSDDQLRQVLSTQGWFGDDINAALNPSAAPVMNPPVGMNVGAVADLSEVAIERKGWSWGAASLVWIWGIRFKIWLSFLTFVPVLSAFWWIVLGIKGREWAWEKQGMTSAADFQASFKRWDKWGLILFVVNIGLSLGMMVLLFNIGTGSLNSAKTIANDIKRKNDLSTISVNVSLYRDNHQDKYPNSLADLENFSSLPKPPNVGEEYGYAATLDRNHFLVYAKLEGEGGYYYINEISQANTLKAKPICTDKCP